MNIWKVMRITYDLIKRSETTVWGVWNLSVIIVYLSLKQKHLLKKSSWQRAWSKEYNISKTSIKTGRSLEPTRRFSEPSETWTFLYAMWFCRPSHARRKNTRFTSRSTPCSFAPAHCSGLDNSIFRVFPNETF